MEVYLLIVIWTREDSKGAQQALMTYVISVGRVADLNLPSVMAGEGAESSIAKVLF